MSKLLLDPERHPPELLAVFENHRDRWNRGEIRLADYLERFYEHNGELRPLWYPEPLGRRVIVDKARIFETLGYRPSDPACRAHASLSKIRVFSGGARAGKSLWCGMELTPLVLSPDMRIWIVAPEYEQGRKEFEYVIENIETDAVRKDWAPMLKKSRISNRPKQGDMEIRLQWGAGIGESFIKVKSAERQRSLLSEELDAVAVVEASQIGETIWSRYLQMRLTTRSGVALFPSSPDGTGWYDKLYQSGLRGEEGCFSINADSRMNPTMSLDEIAFWTSPERMSDEDFEEQVRGKPTPKFGRVFKSFDPDIHVRSWDPSWPKGSWDRGRAFDFGYKDPYVTLWIAKDGERFYVYREFYKDLVLTDEVVEHIAAQEGWSTKTDDNRRVFLTGEPRIERMALGSVADWDASERADLSRRGITTRKAQKDILSGIRTVEELLRPVGPEKRPSLYIHPRCSNLIRELSTYEWGNSGKPKTNQSDHAVDALRYFVHTLAPRRGSMRIRMI